MLKEFANRDELIAYLRQQFPTAEERDDHVSEIVGGRQAAEIVHWRRIHWQGGAKWFLQHLIDGDPASNNMSWQWVASTFSHKPYFFNRENL